MDSMEAAMEEDRDDNNVCYYLPDCLLLEILYRLPAKSVFKFKCVSKHWLSLISDPSFLPYYLSLSEASPPCTLFFRFTQEAPYDISHNSYVTHYVTSNHFEFKSSNFPVPVISCSEQQQHEQPPQSLTKTFNVLAASGDLFLFCSEGLLSVCNFFTKQWIELPKPPCTICHCNGLGFISRVKNGVFHYKVVVITDWSGPRPPLPVSLGSDVLHLQTFSSETGKWRKSNVSLPRPIRLEIPFKRAVPYNGILHWIENQLGIIVAYDPCNKTTRCRYIALPKERENTRLRGMNGVLGVCQGRLRYFEIYHVYHWPGEFRGWSVWVLEDYERGEWWLENKAAKREICELDAHHSIHALRRLLTPIAFHPLDFDIMYFWNVRGYIVTLNLRTGWFDEECYGIPIASIPDEALIFGWSVFPIVIPPNPTPIALPFWKERLNRILNFSLLCLGKR